MQGSETTGLWVDVLIFLIVAVIVYVQSQRGFIPALMEFIGAYGVLCLVNVIDDPLARGLRLFARPETNVAFLHILLFVLLCVPVVMVGIYLDHAIALSLDTFDTILGAIFGLTAGVVVCHAIIGGLVTGASPAGAVYSSIANSTLAQEVLHFETWHNFVNAAGRLGQYD